MRAGGDEHSGGENIAAVALAALTTHVRPTDARRTPRRLQQLARDLEGSRTHLVVDPGLTEIADPRLQTANIDGLPLLA